jgi:hypothetical protein
MLVASVACCLVACCLLLCCLLLVYMSVDMLLHVSWTIACMHIACMLLPIDCFALRWFCCTIDFDMKLPAFWIKLESALSIGILCLK